MSAVSAPPVAEAAIWHEVECGAYSADLGCWLELAAEANGPVVDLGCGTGRVALALARAGHEVVGIDRDRDLLRELARKAEHASLDVAGILGDVRTLPLPPAELILAPMQLIQLLHGPAERARCLGSIREALLPGGRAALAVVGTPPAGAAPEGLLPDVREVDGWVYSSLPLSVEVSDGHIEILRLRQAVDPAGRLTESHDLTRLDTVSPDGLEDEAREAGLKPVTRVAVPPTDDHHGSDVVVLEAR